MKRSMHILELVAILLFVGASLNGSASAENSLFLELPQAIILADPTITALVLKRSQSPAAAGAKVVQNRSTADLINVLRSPEAA